MKVFCENCKYHIQENIDEYTPCIVHRCKINKIKIDNPVTENKIYQLCDIINKKNNCKDFEPNLFYKIKRFFKGEKNEIFK